MGEGSGSIRPPDDMGCEEQATKYQGEEVSIANSLYIEKWDWCA